MNFIKFTWQIVEFHIMVSTDILNNNISNPVINAQIKTEERFEFDKFPFDRSIKRKIIKFIS